MARNPSHHYKPWTPEEIGTLKSLLSEGIPLRVIAKKMGRSPQSVTYRAKTEKAAWQAQPDL